MCWLTGSSIEIADGRGRRWRFLCLGVLLHVDSVRENVACDRIWDGHAFGGLKARSPVLSRSLSGFCGCVSLESPNGLSEPGALIIVRGLFKLQSRCKQAGKTQQDNGTVNIKCSNQSNACIHEYCHARINSIHTADPQMAIALQNMVHKVSMAYSSQPGKEP